MPPSHVFTMAPPPKRNGHRRVRRSSQAYFEPARRGTRGNSANLCTSEKCNKWTETATFQYCEDSGDYCSKKLMFICSNALDEYRAEHWATLNLLNQIPQMSPGAQILVTERQHIQDHIKKRHSRSATHPSQVR